MRSCWCFSKTRSCFRTQKSATMAGGSGTTGSSSSTASPAVAIDGAGSSSASSSTYPPHLMPSALRRMRHFAERVLDKDPAAAADDVIAAVQYLEATAGPSVEHSGVDTEGLVRKARAAKGSCEAMAADIPVDGHHVVHSLHPSDVVHASPVLRVELLSSGAVTASPIDLSPEKSVKQRGAARGYNGSRQGGSMRGTVDANTTTAYAGAADEYAEATTSAERISSILASQQVLVNQELDAERRVHSDLTSGMVDLVGELKKTTLDMNQMVRTQNIQLDEIKEHATSNLEELEKQKITLKQQLHSSSVGFWTSLYMYILVLIAFVVTYGVIRIFPSNR